MSDALQPTISNLQMKQVNINSATEAQLDWLVAECEGARMEDIIIPARPGVPFSRWLRDDAGERTGYYATGQFGYTNMLRPEWMYPIILREDISILVVDSFDSEIGHFRKYAAFSGRHSKQESLEHASIDPSFILSADEASYGKTPFIAAARHHVMQTRLRKLGNQRGLSPHKFEVPVQL